MTHSTQSIQNKVQLITYADSLGKNFTELKHILNTYFPGIIFGVHVLPFYPYSSDRGFSPLTHFEVDPAFGNWGDVIAIAKEHDLMVDFVVNHISQKSVWFQDFLEKGDASEYSDYFITEEQFGEMTPDVLEKIDLPRPINPFTEFTFADGTKRNLWCTFSTDQIDLNTSNPKVRNEFKNILAFLAQQGVKMIRLDAVPYAAKQRGTSCFLIPETRQLIEELADIAHENGMRILTEIHNTEMHSNEYVQSLVSTIKGIDYVYDFALSMLIMNSVCTQKAHHLKNWITIRPKNTITTLDTHDGLPIPDVVDLMPEEEREMLARTIKEKGGEAVERASGANSENVDYYQINCTYYSAIGEDDDAYILARAVQFFVPGIPQVYYVGLFAGKNDVELLDKTRNGRDINRHYYTVDEIQNELERPVVKRLFELIRFRNTYPAFDGEFSMNESSESELKLRWEKEDFICTVRVDFVTLKATIDYVDVATKEQKTIIL